MQPPGPSRKGCEDTCSHRSADPRSARAVRRGPTSPLPWKRNSRCSIRGRSTSSTGSKRCRRRPTERRRATSRRRADRLRGRDQDRPGRDVRQTCPPRSPSAASSSVGLVEPLGLSSARRAPTRGRTGRTSGSSTRRTTAATTRSSATSSGRTHVRLPCRTSGSAVPTRDPVTRALRNWLPELPLVSASSPFAEGVNTGLHSARTQIFTRFFPRCGVPDAFDSWAEYERYVRSSTTPARSASTRSCGGASGRMSPSRPSRSGSATASPISAEARSRRRSAWR